MSSCRNLPITTPDQDEFQINSFATSLGNSIIAIDKPFGTTVALYGEWGTGKSSIINLTKYYLNSLSSYHLNISEFRSWWFQGEDTLAYAFLEHLHETIKSDPAVPESGKKALLNIGKLFCQFKKGIVLAASTTPLAPATPLISEGLDVLAKKINEWDEENNSINSQYQQLVNALNKTSKKYIIVIDDIDRLSPEETLAIFRIIRTIGQLPNIVYLLAFDKNIAINSLKNKFKEQAEIFLEKIIQNSFEVPHYPSNLYQKKLILEIDKVLKNHNEEDSIRIHNIIYDILLPYINAPRRLYMFITSTKTIWPNIKGNINYIDFIILECIRLFETNLYSKIKQNQNILCIDKIGISSLFENNSPTYSFLSDLHLENLAAAKNTLLRLFPYFEKRSSTKDESFYWQSKQRICLSTYFNIYFYLDPNKISVPYSEVRQIIDNIKNTEALEGIFLKAINDKDENGQSKVPKYINELSAHSKEISKEQNKPLLKTIFKIFDKINIESDIEYEFLHYSSNGNKIFILINRILANLNPEERTNLLKESIKDGCLGIMVSLCNKIHHTNELIKENKISSEYLLANPESEEFFNIKTLEKITSLKDDPSFVTHQDLLFILYQWDYLKSKDGTVRKWCDSIIDDDENILNLMSAFSSKAMSSSSSFSEFLPDRGLKFNTRVDVDNKTSFLNIENFRRRLEDLSKSDNLSNDKKERISYFLHTWDKQIEEERRMIRS